jgi:hypothetical protein
MYLIMLKIEPKNENSDAILRAFHRIALLILVISLLTKPFIGEDFDYLYVGTVYLVIFLTVCSSRFRHLLQVGYLNKSFTNSKYVSLTYLMLVITFYYLGWVVVAISIILIGILSRYGQKKKEIIVKYVFPFTLIFFILNTLKVPNRLIDKFHPLYVADDLFVWINDKHTYLDFMGQYNSLLGIIFVGKKNFFDIYHILNQGYWYLIVLQIIGLFLIFLIMKEITKKKIELLVGLIFLFSVTGGLVWANIFSILDFFQELPSRKILPLLMIYLFLIYLRIDFREKKGKRLTLLILSGMVQGISILNDYLFGFGVFLSIITTILILDIPIKDRHKTLLIIISTTFITMISFIVIYYPQNDYQNFEEVQQI